MLPLINQIAIGSSVIFITVIIQVTFTTFSVYMLTRYGRALERPPFLIKTSISLVLLILWLILGISLSAWVWAAVFYQVALFEQMETALYFAIVTYTTLGYGDVVLNPQWRLLGSVCAVNGLIIFGLNTAFLVEFISRLRSAQELYVQTKSKQAEK